MAYSAFHFADTAWLWGLLAVPIIAVLYALFYRLTAGPARLEQFADRHLLPHLLTGTSGTGRPVWRSVLLWSLLWTCGIIALAGPRWSYTDMETFKPQQNLVVLLDLSKSMDAQDVRPSRMAQALEKLDDLLRMAKGMNIGLVGYAADAHMISPVTDDTKTILDLLPDINTSLPYVQGNNLKPALEMASRMLSAEPGKDKSILIISDGGWHDGDSTAMVNDAIKKDIAVYAIGVGTKEGSPIPAQGGGWIKDRDGKMVISRLQADKMEALVDQRDGIYRNADYTDRDIRAILSRISSKEGAAQATGHTTRIWEERFYIPAMILALLILPWFRRGYVFPTLAFLCLLTLAGGNAHAASMQYLFLNKAQQAQTVFNKGNYKAAATQFDTPYRRGVAEYKAGEFANAEKSFAEGQGAMPAAQYNLGNAQVMQGKYENAIASYESVLKRDPHNKNAGHNLEIARKLLQLQKQQRQNEKKNQKSSEQQKPSSGHEQNSASNSQGQQQKQQQQEGNGSNASASNKEGDKHKQSGQKQGKEQQAAGKGNQQTSAQQQQNTQAQQQSQNQNPAKQAAPQETVEPQPQRQEQAGQPNQQANALSRANGKNEGGTKLNPDTTVMAGQEHPRTQKDIDADQWLGRIENDPQSFLKNQFQVETQNNGTSQGGEPW